MSALPASIASGLARWSQPVLEQIESACARPALDDGSLDAMLWYQIDSGGKRLRPLIVLLATEALGGRGEHALPCAAGIELLHNATLIHDDFQDGDTLRRGRPTVWKTYGWEQSINAGDGLYFVGLELITKTPIPGDRLGLLCAIASSRLAQVVRGQVDEFRLKRLARPTLAQYLDVIRGKTAGLFSLPLEAAALVAGTSDAERAALAAAGETLGLLFQIQDDLLDLVGEKGRDQVGTDIAEGKPSLPVVWALNEADPVTSARLHEIIAAPRAQTSSANISEAIGLLEASGAMRFAIAEVKRLAAQVRATNTRIAPLLDDLVTSVLAPIQHRL
jgi:geranylgeranyl pyrophosphate synthase